MKQIRKKKHVFGIPVSLIKDLGLPDHVQRLALIYTNTGYLTIIANVIPKISEDPPLKEEGVK